MVPNPFNFCIISFFMNNINMKNVELQRQVVAKFNPSAVPHISLQTELRHGASMDLCWQLNGVNMPQFPQGAVPKKWSYDGFLFLDIDALPLNEFAIDHAIAVAANLQKLVGNIQNSNHISNDKHLFVAPSVLAVTEDTFVAMGKPSAMETRRADVAEEYTFAAEKNKVPLEFFLPYSFDEAPAEKPFWDLQNESIPEAFRKYGRGTTFGLNPEHVKPILSNKEDTGHRPMFWHQFQSFHPGQSEKFKLKAEAILNG